MCGARQRSPAESDDCDCKEEQQQQKGHISTSAGSHGRSAGVRRHRAAGVAALALAALTLPCVSGCRSWRCGARHPGVASAEPNSALNLLPFSTVLPTDGMSSSAVEAPDGRIFVGGLKGDIAVFKKVTVAPSGDFWRPETTAYVQQWRSSVFPGCVVLSTPAVALNPTPNKPYTVIFACGSRVVAVDGGSASINSLATLWNRDLCDFYSGSGTCLWSVGFGSPVVNSDGSVVYICTGPLQQGTCHALHTDNGSPVWASPFPSSTGSSNYLFTSSPALTDSGQLVLGDMVESKLVIVKAADGTPYMSPLTLGGKISSSPVVAPDGSIYVCSHDGKLYKFTAGFQSDWQAASVCAYTSSDVNAQLRLQASPVLLPDGGVAVAAGDGRVRAVAQSTGAVMWSFFATAGHISSSPVLTPSGILLVGGSDGYLFAFNTTNASAVKEVWRHQVDLGSVISSPLVASDGSVVIGTAAGVTFIGEKPYFAVAAGRERLSMEVEVGGLPAQNLTDGRLGALRGQIAAGTSGLLKGNDVIFVRAGYASRRVLSHKGEEATRLTRDLSASLRVAFVMLFDSAEKKKQAAPLFLQQGMLSIIASGLGGTSFGVVAFPEQPVYGPSTSTPPPTPAATPAATSTTPAPSTTPIDTSCRAHTDCVALKCVYVQCVCSNVGYCIAEPYQPPATLQGWHIALIVAGALLLVGLLIIAVYFYQFKREELAYRSWKARKDEKRRRKHERHAARRGAYAAGDADEEAAGVL